MRVITAFITAALCLHVDPHPEHERLGLLCEQACSRHIVSGYVAATDLGCFVKVRVRNGTGTHVLILEANREGRILGLSGFLDAEAGRPTLPERQIRNELLSFVRRNCSPSAPR